MTIFMVCRIRGVAKICGVKLFIPKASKASIKGFKGFNQRLQRLTKASIKGLERLQTVSKHDNI
jgi:hypothetical protein